MPRTICFFLALTLTGAVRETVTVPMRDGVKLSTDVYRPDAPGRYPVVISRTPYNKAGLRGVSEYFAERGYVALAQDVRGRFESEGDFYPFVNEGLDGYDAIEWAARQPWSTGKVGTWGASYLAWDQYHAAMYQPPHLTAMFADVGGASLIDEYAHPGGIPNLGWARWLLASAASSPAAARDPDARKPLTEAAQNVQAWLALDPKKRGEILAKFPAHARAYADWYAHPAEDEYWRQKGFYTRGNYKSIKDVPIYFLTGWYDYFAEGVLENFVALTKLQKTPKKLMVGPWPHGTGGSECGNASFGPEAKLDKNALMADWFDHWMKGKEYKVVGPETVRLFRMGGGPGNKMPDRTADALLDHRGVWFTSPSWPPKAAGHKRFYLRSGGGLGEKEAGAAEKTYVHDPSNPAPSVGGRYGNCVQDQGVSRRDDVLSYVSEPLKLPVEATGMVTAHLSVRSDAPASDFIVKLMDVYPHGYAMILGEGQIRARGARSELRIDVGSTSNLFAAGHRVRVDISSSNFPRSEPNPAKAKNAVYQGGANASYIELPVREN